MNRFFISLFCSVVLQCPFYIYPQADVLVIDGFVRDQKDESKLAAVRVEVMQNGNDFAKTITKDNGKFEFKLPLEADYMLQFFKRGYVGKKISINARNIPPEDAAFGYEFGGWNVKLFREVEGLDVSILDKPIARIVYDTVANVFTYDKEYIKLVENEMEQMEKDYKKKLKEEALAQKREAKRLEAERIAAEKAAARKKAEIMAQKERERKEKEAVAKARAQQKEKEEKRARQLAAKKAEEKQKQKDRIEYAKINGKSGGKADSVAMPEPPNKKSEKFQQALAKKYPQGITEERYKEGNISYIRRVIVDGSRGTEYIEAVHPWGGRFFFRNGESITERVWQIETEKNFNKDK